MNIDISQIYFQTINNYRKAFTVKESNLIELVISTLIN